MLTHTTLFGLPTNDLDSSLFLQYPHIKSDNMFNLLILCSYDLMKYKNYNYTTAVQPVATCHQSPYLHKPAIVIVTSFSL